MSLQGLKFCGSKVTQNLRSSLSLGFVRAGLIDLKVGAYGFMVIAVCA